MEDFADLGTPVPKKSYLEQIELQAKLLNYFLGSNKSNINQNSGSLLMSPYEAERTLDSPRHGATRASGNYSCIYMSFNFK